MQLKETLEPIAAKLDRMYLSYLETEVAPQVRVPEQLPRHLMPNFESQESTQTLFYHLLFHLFIKFTDNLKKITLLCALIP